MRIRLEVDGSTLNAVLDDNDAAKDFARLLPLNLALTDYASTEKIADLPRKLSTTSAPSGTDASAGDIAYYAPWGNLALFYRASGYASGLVTLGRIDGDIDVLSRNGTLTAKIERMTTETTT